MRWLLVLLLAVALGCPGAAWAAGGCQSSPAGICDCSGSVGTTSQPLFSGAEPLPTSHLEITNPAQNANDICVRPIGSTAVCGVAGSVTIVPGGDKWWDFPDLPQSPSIVASGASTPYQCDYQ